MSFRSASRGDLVIGVNKEVVVYFISRGPRVEYELQIVNVSTMIEYYMKLLKVDL